MKVNFKNLISGYTGRMDDAIVIYDRKINRYYVRSWPHRKVMPGNITFREMMANLGKINPSEGFREDMRSYVDKFNALPINKYNPVKAWNNLFMKMMYALAASDPSVNLKTLTRQEIYEQGLPCRSVAGAVEAGLLPVVKGYQRFNSLL